MRADPEGFRPRRRWGQNFLVNPGAIEAILRAFRPRPDDLVLEIGPGRGALTFGLAGRVGRLVAVEIDPLLAAALRRALPGQTRGGAIEIVEADVLRLDLADLLRRLGAGPARPARVIANLPFGAATAILLALIGRRALLSDLMVMVQREVAARIASPPGRKTYGGLSVLCQAYARVESVLRLKPGSFRPRPKVESEVVRLTLRDPGGAAGRDPETLAALLRAAFARRRKTLANNLARLPRPGGPEGPAPAPAGAPQGPARMRAGTPRGVLGPVGAEALIRAAGLDPGARPEQVPVAGYLALLEASLSAGSSAAPGSPGGGYNAPL
jgi:16S rRNA (adenine1518-N6/adenine1519-N6)-dimethyltransferase